MPFAGKDATIKTGGTPTAMANEACTEITGTRFQVTDATRRIIDATAAIVVRVNTVVQDPSTYTVDHLFGFIDFNASQTGQTVDISADYIPTLDFAEVRSTSPTFGIDLEDSTTIGDDAHEVTALLQTFNASIETLEDGLTDLDPGGGTVRIADLLRNGTPFLYELGMDGTGGVGYRAWAKGANLDPSAAFDALVQNTFAIEGDKQNGADNVWGYGTF